MREISLHILDIVQNSIRAGASRIAITVEASEASDVLTVRVQDDGCGMSVDFVAKLTDPFVTTRTTRKVGLGIPMLAAAAELAGGSLSIDSEVGRGTTVEASFGLNHIDRPPFGDIVGTLVSLLVANPDASFRYDHVFNGEHFVLDTEDMKGYLGEVPVGNPLVVGWLREYIEAGISGVGQIT